MNEQTKLRVTVSISDGQIVDINPNIEVDDDLEDFPQLEDVQDLVSQDLVPLLTSESEMAIALTGFDACYLRVIPHDRLLSYDSESNSMHRSVIHEEVMRLDALCKFLRKFAIMTSYKRARDEHIYYAKALAYLVNTGSFKFNVGNIQI